MLATGDWQEQYIEIVEREIEQAVKNNIPRIIVSNESIFGLYAAFEPVFNRVKDKADLAYIVVVRNFIELAFSSYMQWFVKDKTLAGPLLSFGEWLALERDGLPWIHEELGLWLSSTYFKSKNLISLDKTCDLLEEFCSLADIQPTIKGGESKRMNQKDDQLTFLLRTVYQSMQTGKSPPERFEDGVLRAIQRLSTRAPVSVQIPSDIAPRGDDLAILVEACNLRAKLFNEVLTKFNLDKHFMHESSLLDIAVPAAMHACSIEEDKLKVLNALAIAMLAIESQQQRISELESQIFRSKCVPG